MRSGVSAAGERSKVAAEGTCGRRQYDRWRYGAGRWGAGGGLDPQAEHKASLRRWRTAA